MRLDSHAVLLVVSGTRDRACFASRVRLQRKPVWIAGSTCLKVIGWDINVEYDAPAHALSLQAKTSVRRSLIAGAAAHCNRPAPFFAVAGPAGGFPSA